MSMNSNCVGSRAARGPEMSPKRRSWRCVTFGSSRREVRRHEAHECSRDRPEGSSG
jgi:hypothetical protein